MASTISSCFGFRKSRAEDHEPLLPQYNDDTSLQRLLHQKLHSYQMIRALGMGYMPSNEQLIVNLRTLLAADLLNPDNEDLSDSGRHFVRHVKKWLHQFITLLQHKNSEDQIQDFIWYLSKSRVDVDINDLSRRASKAKARSDTTRAYASLKTVGSLFLTNSDFRIFLSDLNVLMREVFKETAFKLSEVAEDAGKKIEPSQKEQAMLKQPGADSGTPPTRDELNGELAEVTQTVGEGAIEVVKEAEHSFLDKIGGDEKNVLLHRLKKAVLKLRHRPDYNESVSTLALLVKQYAYYVAGTDVERALIYSGAVKDAVRKDVNINPELDRAAKNFWTLLTSFGDKDAWSKLASQFKQLMDHRENDEEFDELINDVGDSLEKVFTDPDTLDSAGDKFKELRKRYQGYGTQSSLRTDVDNFLEQLQITIRSVFEDEDIAALLTTSQKILNVLWPRGYYWNSDLLADTINVFIPLTIQMIQYIPIPRLEIATPEIDLLLENLIIEPGRTINNTSFLPYRLRIETYNDLEIRKARFSTTSSVNSMVTIKIDGLSMRADEVGYWFRLHSGIFRLADEGIASFQLDDRGIDIHMDVEIGKERLEKILTLKAVRVHVHKLSYTLRKSKFSFFGWLFKPIVRPIVRKLMEKQLANAVADAIHAANRELLFARERLRATRISDPDDIRTFVKAIITRLTPREDPDFYARVGVTQPGEGVFKGVYAPGSVVKLWNEEAGKAKDRIEDDARQGWRNDIFDVTAMV